MRVRSFERGQVLPLVAICLALLMGFAGIAIDVGYLEYQQRQQQNATDAAAIGGAQQLVYSGCTNSYSVANTAAQNDAATNGYTNGATGPGGSTIQVNVQNPPSSGAYAGNNCAVQVQIQSPHATFFSRLFGQANATDDGRIRPARRPDCHGGTGGHRHPRPEPQLALQHGRGHDLSCTDGCRIGRGPARCWPGDGSGAWGFAQGSRSGCCGDCCFPR
jgi:Putative Flp pilus-assembly TadE/G-like